MKIILVDNFDREGPGHDDKEVIPFIEEGYWADHIVSLLNAWASRDPYTVNFFKLVPDGYKLQEFKP